MNLKRIIREEIGDFDWAKDTQPIELQNPKGWIGMSFGYGTEIIDSMTDREIEQGDDETFYTITGIDKNGNLSLIRTHPTFGDTDDSSTNAGTLIEYINRGAWIWI